MESGLLLVLVVCCQANVIHQPAKPECSCINSFSDSIQNFLGDKNITCQYERLCYVDCDSSCEDVQPAEGFTAKEGRCISKIACLPVPDAPTTCPPPTGGDKFCECLDSEAPDGACEVDCMSDCNDLSRVGGKCFSVFANEDPLLFDEDC
eukprot:GFUD01124286.1.p1 GENE.GFUD01124286.1~~GFUD01124286.1.p1  ORF type:complete len:150 (+),score=41.68 GFUD01124286.1:604-1053(+)